MTSRRNEDIIPQEEDTMGKTFSRRGSISAVMNLGNRSLAANVCRLQYLENQREHFSSSFLVSLAKHLWLCCKLKQENADFLYHSSHSNRPLWLHTYETMRSHIRCITHTHTHQTGVTAQALLHVAMEIQSGAHKRVPWCRNNEWSRSTRESPERLWLRYGRGLGGGSSQDCKWLITMVSKSPKSGCSPSKWPFHGL